MIASPDPDDLARVKAWFQRLAQHVRKVDFAGAREIFAPDMIAFGTVKDFVDGQPGAEAAQWKSVWPFIDDFRWRIDELRAIVSADRLTAVGMAVFDSTGYHQDGRAYDRPGRATIVLSRRRVGEDWVADHTHLSLFSGTPPRSYGPKRGA
ncbi:MAG: nuclear transport factor 2 family protein [Alphaproteobacteria bacterium]|nr:nuclear transport factor 2 family protein [Alphaproteobacteria bacterium]